MLSDQSAQTCLYFHYQIMNLSIRKSTRKQYHGYVVYPNLAIGQFTFKSFKLIGKSKHPRRVNCHTYFTRLANGFM